MSNRTWGFVAHWLIWAVAFHLLFAAWLCVALTEHGMAGMGYESPFFVHQILIFFLGERPPKISYAPYQFDYQAIGYNLMGSIPASLLYGLCAAGILRRFYKFRET